MITIVPYKASWPGQFQEIGKNLRLALGDRAVRIDHIGSTPVPGLAAKDLIDIQVTVNDLTPALEEALERAEYVRRTHITRDHVPPGYPADEREWTKWFFRPVDAESAINIHVRLSGRANQRYALLFRDYLRTHPATAEAYGQVKRALVAQWHDNEDHGDAYYDVKDPVCDIIIGAAEEWATVTQWQQGPSDC